MELDMEVTDLHLASSRGDVSIIDKLLTKNGDVNCCTNLGWTPLMCAARNGHFDAFQKLIYHGANIFHTNKLGVSVLSMAVASRNKGIIKLLLKSLENQKDFNVKEYLILPFFISLVYGDMNLLQLFLDMERELINITDKYGVSPLMIAIAGSKVEVINFLISSGAAANESDKTALDSIILQNHNTIKNTLHSKDSAYGSFSKSDNVGSDLIKHYGWSIANSINKEDLMSSQEQGSEIYCKKAMDTDDSNTYTPNVKANVYNFPVAKELYTSSVSNQNPKYEYATSNCVPVPPLSPYSNVSNLNVKRKNYCKFSMMKMNNSSEILQCNLPRPENTTFQNAEMSCLSQSSCQIKNKKPQILGKKGKMKLSWSLSLSERFKRLFFTRCKQNSISSLTTERNSGLLKANRSVCTEGEKNSSLPETLETSVSLQSSVSNLLKFMNLDDYILVFEKQEVDMQSFLMLDKRDLEEMGITCTDSQQKLLSIIDFMKTNI